MEGLANIPPGLFSEAIEAGEAMEIVGEFQMWIFQGRFRDGPWGARLALGVRSWDNADPDQTHVRALVLTEQMLVKLIVAAQHELQNMQRLAPPGAGDEPR